MPTTICPKCSYARKSADAAVPDWQCPSCGIVYAKYGDRAPAPPQRAQAESTMAGHSMSAKALFWILAGVTALGYFGYQKFYSNKEGAGTEFAAGSPTEGARTEASNPAFYGTMERGGVVLRMKPETSAGLARISSSANVVMFATSWCPYCAKAREVFARNGVRYAELDIERDSQAKSFQESVMGMSGVPTIVIGNRVMHGFDEGQILAGLKEL
jgi:glutaredoxin